MGKTKVTVSVEFEGVEVSSAQSTSAKSASAAGLPGRERRRELATLYEALVKDLVEWKDTHPDRDEGPGDGPIVWHVHDAIREGGTRSERTKRVNRVLEKLGPEHHLDEDQVERLADLMLSPINASLAPYLPPMGGAGQPGILGW